MKRVEVLFLALIAVIAMVAPAAAQPKVTITGFIDQVTSYTRNLSTVDLNLARNSDTEWWARTRVRPDITAEVGTTKFVLGLEMDFTWGQTANQDTNVCLGAACPAAAGTAQRFGTNAGSDLNTDVQGIIEIKWAYTEFNLPIIPVPTRMRLGAQPFETTYKHAALASGDFAGVHVTSQWTPIVKTNLTFVSIEEQSTGVSDNFIRGDDWAVIGSLEVTPFKGLDLRPIFSYANYIGVTSTSSRAPRGGLGVSAASFPTCPGTTGPGTGGCLGGGINSAIEDRFTVGLDTRWRFGAFSLDPTVMYQFGSREQISPIASLSSGPGVQTTLQLDAWYVDLQGGWQAGPLLVEARGIYTTGNKARDRIDLNRSRVKFYQPIDTDTSWYANWTEVLSSSIDYLNFVRATATGLNTANSIGYDKYGLIRAGLRASYALTPAFTLRVAANASWTAEEVDTASTLAAATGLTPRCAAAAVDNGSCRDDGTARYLGTELDLGFQWRFAPNIVFDLVGAYLCVGPAYATHLTSNTATGIARNGRDPQDVQTVAARVRYSF